MGAVRPLPRHWLESWGSHHSPVSSIRDLWRPQSSQCQADESLWSDENMSLHQEDNQVMLGSTKMLLGVIHSVNLDTLSRSNAVTEDSMYCFSPLCFPRLDTKRYFVWDCKNPISYYTFTIILCIYWYYLPESTMAQCHWMMTYNSPLLCFSHLLFFTS